MPQFQKIIVARHSPQNECFAEEGDILYPPIPTPIPRSKERYYFQSTRDPSKKSKFGWVRSVPSPISLDDFLNDYLNQTGNTCQRQTLCDLLSAIVALPEDTPVAGSYFPRGVENRHLELAFHKVFFFKGR